MPKPYIVKDNYFKQAKIQGFRARSAFKLIEINERFDIFRRNQKVFDLGAFPGSFIQVIAPIIGEKGLIVAVDLQTIKRLPFSNVKTFVADIYDTITMTEIILDCTDCFDVIVSDAAPNTSGINDVDHGKSVDLNRQVLRIAKAYLRKGGKLIMKIFMGEEFPDFLKEIKNNFDKVRCFRPKATRDRSKETYIIAMGYNPNAKKILNK
jgi:23S rRNA (uridine2552-2'-O)-methyltransferase